MSWSTDDIPDLAGRRAVITGVTGGLGFHTALELGRAGAALTVTARNPSKADDTVARLRAELPDLDVEVLALDLADLADARRAGAELVRRHDQIDVLVNNAGIMIPPYSTTADGFELQIGTNHIGHFAWTAELWPVLRRSGARIVSVSSVAHTTVRGIDLRTLAAEGPPRRYKRWRSYGESKLANLVFALELDRRAKASGLATVSVAAHPGLSSTNLQKTGVAMGNPLAGSAFHQVSRVVAQSAAHGAWPLLRAATDPTFEGGEYIGPASLGGLRGRPRPARYSRTARDEQLGDALWEASEQAVGATFDV
ncbi:oxidoreductase [Aeromicrobium sp. CTD01-1L150]|uniref:oxidoreductase n=1 Tax=Aeromicrobium sp. CTD01-1L150 TaxID=3341830 RepID=UPI0035BEE51D